MGGEPVEWLAIRPLTLSFIILLCATCPLNPRKVLEFKASRSPNLLRAHNSAVQKPGSPLTTTASYAPSCASLGRNGEENVFYLMGFV